MKSYKNHRFWILSLVTAILVISIVSLIPHDGYLRYQLLDVGTYKKSKWIYERVHFSKTPIDVAFFGTSHTLNGIDSELVEDIVNAQLDTPRHVVNFSIPHFGRDMHYTLIKLLLEKHKPELIVLELRESEARDLHPGTHYLADSLDLLTAPLILNLRYPGNIIRVPSRNLKSLLHELAYPFTDKALRNDDVADHNNMALSFYDGRSRDIFISREELEKQRTAERKSAPYKYQPLPEWKSYLFYNANTEYLKKIKALTDSKNVRLALLYLPEYGTTSIPLRHPLIQRDIPLITAPMPFYQRDDVFNDLGHLNKRGAIVMSELVAGEIVERIAN